MYRLDERMTVPLIILSVRAAALGFLIHLWVLYKPPMVMGLFILLFGYLTLVSVQRTLDAMHLIRVELLPRTGSLLHYPYRFSEELMQRLNSFISASFLFGFLIAGAVGWIMSFYVLLWVAGIGGLFCSGERPTMNSLKSFRLRMS